MESGWATASRHDADEVRREVFYFRSGPDLLYASLYRRIRPTTELRVLVCPSWGMEGKQLLQWCHQLARGVSDLGGTGLVVHWPGFEDSEGDPEQVTKFDRLIDACRDGNQRGAATPTASAGRLPASGSVPPSPCWPRERWHRPRPVGARRARRSTRRRTSTTSSASGVSRVSAAAVSPGGRSPHPLPDAIRGPESSVSVASRAAGVFRPRGDRPPPDSPHGRRPKVSRCAPCRAAGSAARSRTTAPCSSPRDGGSSTRPRRGERVMTDHPVLIPTTAGVLGGVVTETCLRPGRRGRDPPRRGVDAGRDQPGLGRRGSGVGRASGS